MKKRIALGTLAVFILWSVLDNLIHGSILAPMYRESAHLWRPIEQMKSWLLLFVVLISSAVFVYIYAAFSTVKSMTRALIYGFVFGLGAGTSMAYGSYSVLPLPYMLALGWFLGTVVETTLGGVLLGLIVKEPAASSSGTSNS